MLKDKIRNIKDCSDNSKIYDVYYNEPLDDELVYFESRNGFDFIGNIFRIVEELSSNDYGEFKICVFVKEDIASKVKEFQKNYNLKINKIITDEKEACKVLEKAKYIFTDSGILPKYVKKEGQIFINTWHGTPLKLMGADNSSEFTSIGHIQHSLLSSDYLIYPNEYMKDKMMDSYMIEKIYPGKVLMEGYPRNTVFFKKSNLKDKLNLTNKEIFVYMPTFRGDLNNKDDSNQKFLEKFLSEIDSKLKDDQLLLVKLHPYNQSQIDFSKFDNIDTFPKEFEPYDIINMADCLITDYSSIFFDFANSSRKIIIFNYDEEDYLESRGLYFSLSDLPFPKVSNVDELIGQMNLDKDYDDSDFIEEFCRYDNPNATKNICEHIFRQKDSCLEISGFNSKPNVLIHAGSLTDDMITQLINVLDRFDEDDHNIYVMFRQWDDYILENYKHILDKIPDHVEFLALRSNLTPTFNEKMDYNKYFKSDDLRFPESLHKLFKRSFDKQFKSLNFEVIINLDINKLDESFILTHSNADNTILVCENISNLNNKIIDAANQFNTIFVSKDVRKLLSENIDNGKLKLIEEWK